MSGGNALLKLASEVEARASDTESLVSRGAVEDWAKYREKVGEIRAYRRSAELIRELHNKLFKEEEDD